MTGNGPGPDAIASTEIDRRNVLRAGSALVATGLAGSTAGCLDALPISNPLSGGRTADWLYEPGTMGGGDHYDFTYLDGTALAGHEDAFDDDFYGQLEDAIEGDAAAVDLDLDELSTYLIFSWSLVLEGAYSTEDVVDELEANDFSAEDDHEGYEVFDQGGMAWGVGDDALVRGRAAETKDAAGVVAATIDTQIGEEDRFVDESEAMDTLVGRLSGGTLAIGGTFDQFGGAGPFEDAAADGLSVSVDGETSTLKRVAVFEDSDDYEGAAFEDWVDDNDGSGEAFDDVEDPTVNTEGTVVVVSGTLPTEDMGFNHLGG